MNRSKPKRRTREKAEEDRKKLIGLIAWEGGVTSQYKADQKTGDVSWSSIRRDLAWFVDKKFLIVGEGARGAKPHSLTFKGLIHALKVGALTPQRAREARLRNKIQIPTPKFPPELKALVDIMEKEAPEVFYHYFAQGVVDLDVVTDEVMVTLTVALGLFTLLTKYLQSPEDMKKHLKGKNLILGELVLENFAESFPSMLKLLKPIMPKDMQKLIDQRLKELKASSELVRF